MLQVAFTESRLRKDGAAVPRIVQRETVSYEEVLAFMSKGAVVSESDMTAVMTQFTEALVHYLVKGKRVQTPLGFFTIHVRGGGSGAAQRTISTDVIKIKIRPTPTIGEELKRNLQVAVVDTPSVPIPLVYQRRQRGKSKQREGWRDSPLDRIAVELRPQERQPRGLFRRRRRSGDPGRGLQPGRESVYRLQDSCRCPWGVHFGGSYPTWKVFAIGGL